MRKNCSSDREILLKFKAEGQEFLKILRPLEQFIQTVKGQNNFWKQNVFLTFPAYFYIPIFFSNLNSNCSNLLDTYEKPPGTS